MKSPTQTSSASSTKPPAKKAKKASSSGRQSTDPHVKTQVLVRAAGRCEQCGKDLTQDHRIGKATYWGEVAHIQPASSIGPRSVKGYRGSDAKSLTNDPDNLMLLCGGCHELIDKDPDGYPTTDLVQYHLDHVAQIAHAASVGETRRAVGLIFLSQHFETKNMIANRDLAQAMFTERLWCVDTPARVVLPEPGPNGRDDLYWRNVEQVIEYNVQKEFDRFSNQFGDPLALGIVGLADIPALIRFGRKIGDRTHRYLYSYHREQRLVWPDLQAPPPEFTFVPANDGNGPLALLISLSAEVNHNDILAVLPDARIAEFSTPQPNYGLVTSRAVIDEFRRSIQLKLSVLEASTAEPIHLFAVIPAALAIELGALLSTNHLHPYHIYDRGAGNAFFMAMILSSKSI